MAQPVYRRVNVEKVTAVAAATWVSRTRLVVFAALAGLLMTACGTAGFSGSTTDVACSITGSTRFPVSYLDGPEYSRADFIDTESGSVLEAFFLGGEGEPENQQYLESDGFSQVSKSLVIGYRAGLPVAHFNLEDHDIRGWGGCHPNLMSGDLVAYRWQPVYPIDPELSVLPIVVEGGGCVTGSETKTTTDVQSVNVVESPDRVEITVWVRERSVGFGCSGVGVAIDAEATLSKPVGSRILVDAGLIPPTEAGSR